MSPASREEITFASGDGTCAGWLFTPEPASGRVPVVVMAHGLGGVMEMGLDAFAERFAQAGWAVLVFDYRHFGASGGEPRQLIGIRRQHQDWLAAVEFARSRDEVDPDRLALWGYSLSGGHVMALAAQVRPTAVIVQMPHVNGFASVLQVPPRTLAPVIAHGLRDLFGSAFGRPPHYLPIIGASGDVALMTAPEALHYKDLVPEGKQFDNRVAARLALAIGLYSPGRKLRRISAPVLVQVGTTDQITPAAPGTKAASRAPNATLATYDAHHFEPFTSMFETFVNDQIAFLHKHLDA